MDAILRGIRNVARNPVRSLLVAGVLALGMAIAVSLLDAAGAVRERTGELAGEVGNLIEVRAKGATGMGLGAQALAERAFESAQRIPGVARAERYLFQRTTDPARPLATAIFVGVAPGATPRVASHGEVGNPRLVEGRFLAPEDRGRPVAVVGRLYADQYGLDVGSLLRLPTERIAPPDRARPSAVIKPLSLRVVGIFESGFAFGDTQVFLPLDVAQRAFDQRGRASHIFVTVDSVENVEEVERALRRAFSGKADIISGQAQARRFAATLEVLEGNANLGAALASALAALVVAFAMALVTRERTREIGVLKAMGASDLAVARQFVAEAHSLVAAAGALAALVYFLAGPALTRLLLPPVATQTAQALHGASDPLSAIGVRAAADPSLEGLGLALALALLLGVVGSLYPVVRAVRLQPSEAIRYA